MKGTMTVESRAPCRMGALPPIRRVAPFSFPWRRALGIRLMQCMQRVQSASSMERVFPLFVPGHAFGRAKPGDLFPDIQPGSRVGLHFLLVDLDLSLPGPDDGKVRPGNGRHAIIGAGRSLNLELVREHGAVNLVLEVHGKVVADIQAVDAGPFAAGRPHAGTGVRRAEPDPPKSKPASERSSKQG